jgi:isopropylmalate/homocitrate/citramalate synthase
MGYKIPPTTPFVGMQFNETRAGIHADGLLKDAEIYTIFDTEKLLNRPATVVISKTSGAAGIAYWINQNYRLTGTENELLKNDPLVSALKAWIDQQYEDDRQTVMSRGELEEKIEELAPGRFSRL